MAFVYCHWKWCIYESVVSTKPTFIIIMHIIKFVSGFNSHDSLNRAFIIRFLLLTLTFIHLYFGSIFLPIFSMIVSLFKYGLGGISTSEVALLIRVDIVTFIILFYPLFFVLINIRPRMNTWGHLLFINIFCIHLDIIFRLCY